MQGITRCLDIEKEKGNQILDQEGQQFIEDCVDELSADAAGLKLLPGNAYLLFTYFQVRALQV